MVRGQRLTFDRALRLPNPRQSAPPVVAFTGSGGKTTAMFQLARSLQPPVVVSATTHLGRHQANLADSHWMVERPQDLEALQKIPSGVTLVTGPLVGERTRGLSEALMDLLHDLCRDQNTPLLIEADGSRQKPLKAPAAHEPVIPPYADTVITLVGLSGIGIPLSSETVFRPELFASLAGLEIGDTITVEALGRELGHPQGGLQHIPPSARRILLLNQADNAHLQGVARSLAENLHSSFPTAVIASLAPNSNEGLGDGEPASRIHAVLEPVAGILLAAGGSTRFGSPKALLDWHGHPFVRAVAETAILAGLCPLIIVTGAEAEQVETVLQGLPASLIRNPAWQAGQSTSIRAGLASLGNSQLLQRGPGRCPTPPWLPEQVGAALFLLADQPQITPAVLRALVDEHARTLAPILAPQVQDRRANPVLFDQCTFPALMDLRGDVGGRAIFSQFPPAYLPWQDTALLLDVDTPEQYRRLLDEP